MHGNRKVVTDVKTTETKYKSSLLVQSTRTGRSSNGPELTRSFTPVIPRSIPSPVHHIYVLFRTEKSSPFRAYNPCQGYNISTMSMKCCTDDFLPVEYRTFRMSVNLIFIHFTN